MNFTGQGSTEISADYKKGGKGVMKILVTEGAWLIAANLCNELYLKGYEIIACSPYSTGRNEYIRWGVKNFRKMERESYAIYSWS